MATNMRTALAAAVVETLAAALPDATVIRSNGTDWYFVTTGALVQSITITAQPANGVTGGPVVMSVTAVNLVSVKFQIETSGGAAVGDPQTLVLVGGATTFTGHVNTAGTGYKVRATNPAGGNVYALSNAFNIIAAPGFSFDPSTALGADLVAWIGTLVPGDIITSGGNVTEWRSKLSSSNKLTSFGSTLPTVVPAQGITGDRDAISCAGGALDLIGNTVGGPNTWAALAAALDGDIATTNLFIALCCKIPANNRTIIQWRGTGSRFELRANGTSPWQLLVQAPSGSVQTYFTSVGTMDGNLHTIGIGKVGTALSLWIDKDPALTANGTATISGTSGTFAGTDFVMNAQNATPPYTPHSVGASQFFGVLAGKGSRSNADRLGMMQTVAYETGMSL